jgi:FkbM family methyltransferase
LDKICAIKIDNHKLSFSGKINYNQFFNSTDSKKIILCSTIDTRISNNYRCQKVGFLHLDVEGLEYEVLTGSINTIKNNLPLIIFEHHLKDLDKFIEIKFIYLT